MVFLCRFLHLRSYRNEIDTRNQEEIPFSSQVFQGVFPICKCTCVNSARVLVGPAASLFSYLWNRRVPVSIVIENKM